MSSGGRGSLETMNREVVRLRKSEFDEQSLISPFRRRVLATQEEESTHYPACHSRTLCCSESPSHPLDPLSGTHPSLQSNTAKSHTGVFWTCKTWSPLSTTVNSDHPANLPPQRGAHPSQPAMNPSFHFFTDLTQAHIFETAQVAKEKQGAAATPSSAHLSS